MTPWIAGLLLALGSVVVAVENALQARKIRRLQRHLECEEDEHARTIQMYNEAVAGGSSGHPYREAVLEEEQPIYRVFRSPDSAKWSASNKDGEAAFNCGSAVDALESLVAMEDGECLSEGCDGRDGHEGDCLSTGSIVDEVRDITRALVNAGRCPRVGSLTIAGGLPGVGGAR